MAMLLGFTPDQVCRVTGLSKRQLRYWDKTGFFSPRYRDPDRRRFGRMYSFKDVVGLKTIANLRQQLPLQELRRVGAWLHERYEEPWNTLQFWVVGRCVAFEDPEGMRRMAGDDRMILPISVGEIEEEAERAATDLVCRRPDQIGRIVRNRYVQHNAWVLDGTRIPTSAVWNFHDAGYDVEAIQREYPRLTAEDVCAAIAFEERDRKAG